MTAEQRLRHGAEQLEIALTDELINRLIQFLDELLRWNQRINLSAIRNQDEAIEKHLLDSLTLLPWLPQKCHLLDIGSGGGFPGFPLKIVRDDLHLTSVDSVGKKIQFQRHVARLMALDKVQPIDCRVENLPQQKSYQGPFDWIVSRAFSDLASFVDYALPLLKTDGIMLAMKGADGATELDQARESMKKRGCFAEVLQQLKLPFSQSQRYLIKITKC